MRSPGCGHPGPPAANRGAPHSRRPAGVRSRLPFPCPDAVFHLQLVGQAAEVGEQLTAQRPAGATYPGLVPQELGERLLVLAGFS